jgi:glycosyltransferase involved in cell wall biosynthesis
VNHLRIAFLTPEFVSKGNGTGGLSAYVYRMCKTLVQMGHVPEVFTPGNAKQGVLDFHGIRVQYTGPSGRNLLLKLIGRLRLQKLLRLKDSVSQLRIAKGIAEAVERRNQEQPFHLIHSSDVGIPGFYVGRATGCPLVVRCSWSRDLWLATDGANRTLDVRCQSLLDRILMSRADLVYAPSRFLADYYGKKGLRVETLRPPFVLETKPAPSLPRPLPSRFLLHFGTLGPIKGTDVLAEALPLVWEKEPQFTMVWAGQSNRWTSVGYQSDPGYFDRLSKTWGEKASQVIWIKEVKKAELYAVLTRAEASALPSRCDNLPNTAIESLLLGIPVIGTRGASLDELIDDGVNGILVPIDDTHALAEAMIRVWRGNVPWVKHALPPPSLIHEMSPEVAASRLIEYAGLAQYRVDNTSLKGRVKWARI